MVSIYTFVWRGFVSVTRGLGGGLNRRGQENKDQIFSVLSVPLISQ